MSAGAFTERTRETIRARAKGRCEKCGLPLAAAQIHHRQPRGMGGSSEAVTSDPSNGLIVHPACHAKIESHRETAYENGWLVSKALDPATVPVKTWMGWRLLGVGYRPAPDAEARAQVDRT